MIDLFTKFESRDDVAIREAVTNNANVPTIFEYILGIAWYVISTRKGDVLEYMNLSLEADLLSRTHASGVNVVQNQNMQGKFPILKVGGNAITLGVGISRVEIES